MSTDGTEQAWPAADAIGRRGRPRLPPKWVWVVVAVLGLGAAIVQASDALRDHAAANIVTFALTLVALVTLATWFFSQRVYLAVAPCWCWPAV